MENNTTTAALNDLLKITNDRLEGFKNMDKIMISSPNPGLSDEYEHMITQSSTMRNDLALLIQARGGQPDDSPTVSGNLHRVWMDLKISLTGNRDAATLNSVVFGENAAIQTYENVLSSQDLCTESRRLVQNQLDDIKASYEKLKYLAEKNE